MLLTAGVQTLLMVLGLVLVLIVVGHLSNYVRGFTSAGHVPLDAITAAKPVEGVVVDPTTVHRLVHSRRNREKNDT